MDKKKSNIDAAIQEMSLRVSSLLPKKRFYYSVVIHKLLGRQSP